MNDKNNVGNLDKFRKKEKFGSNSMHEYKL